MLKVILVSFGLSLMGAFLLLGIPGALILAVARPITNWVYGPLAHEAWDARMGEELWPLSILLSLVWPVFIPISYVATSVLFPEESLFSSKRLVVFCAVILICAVTLAQSAIVLTGKVKRLTDKQLLQTAILVGDLNVLRRVYDPSKLGEFIVDPLADAIFYRRTDLVEFLIQSRTQWDRYTPEPEESVQFASPLHTAVNVNSVAIARMLLQKGADPNVATSQGQTPLHAIPWHPDGNGEILLLLKQHGADFSRKDEEGNTPLMAMAKNCLNHWPGIAQYGRIMIENGVDPKARNVEGLTAFDYATQNHHDSLLSLLSN